MKKNILFAASLLMGMLCGISAQEYYIEGFYERHGEDRYTLRDVHTNGIYLDGRTSLDYTLQGTKEDILCGNLEATMVQFSFEKADFGEGGCPTRWSKGFTFQFWDDDKNDWRTDNEACKGQTTSYSQKDMVIMLVLDYSSSMQNNISRIQSYAVNFINSVSRVSNGNVHIGIIAFSGMNQARSQIFPITPIDKDNRYRFEQFIRNAKMGKETALYFSMDVAMRMIEDYVRTKGMSPQNYNGSCMITFTDGLDNASINDNISVTMHRGSRNEYLGYLSERLSGPSRTTILGMPLESFAIGFTGSENFTQDDRSLFHNVLQKTTPDEHHFRLADRFDEVEAYFQYITQQLTQRWETLNMYIGEAQYGRVRWVLNCGEPARPAPKPAPAPAAPRSSLTPWVGISAEVGSVLDVFYGLSLDMAFSISGTVAIGGRLGIMSDTYNEMGLLVGPEVKITFPNNSAVIAGVGGGMVEGEGVAYLRAGYKLPSSLFFTADVLYGEEAGGAVGIGFSFGGKRRD